ncbi:MAG TPA: AraC family transcriptional regulator [Pirellulales bacterium]
MSRRERAVAELRVRGAEIGLPLVETLGTIRSHSASRVAWHTHERFELLFLTDGATAYEFSGGRTLALPGGHFLVVPPGARHRGRHDVRMPAGLCGIVFDPRRKGSGRNTSFAPRDLRWLAEQFEQAPLTAQAAGPELRRLVAVLSRQVRAFHDGATNRADVLSLRLSVIAVLLESAKQLTSGAPIPPQRAIEAALAHLEGCWREPLRMSDLAQAAGCSRARLFEVFKQATGMTPNDYLVRLRVNKACEFLADPARSVTDVAYAAGFSSSQYFSNVFRKYINATPSEFRRRAR